jgi:hypothetical protein
MASRRNRVRVAVARWADKPVTRQDRIVGWMWMALAAFLIWGNAMLTVMERTGAL